MLAAAKLMFAGTTSFWLGNLERTTCNVCSGNRVGAKEFPDRLFLRELWVTCVWVWAVKLN